MVKPELRNKAVDEKNSVFKNLIKHIHFKPKNKYNPFQSKQYKRDFQFYTKLENDIRNKSYLQPQIQMQLNKSAAVSKN